MSQSTRPHFCSLLHERISDSETREDIAEECDLCNGNDGVCLFEKMLEVAEQSRDDKPH